jgi:DNA-binding response OmpR family regulator
MHEETDESGIRQLELTVNDTGIGIPKENQEKIFERFFQNDLPSNIISEGSGIGLAITKEFVKLFNGSITVISEPGKGSSFILMLPFKETVNNEEIEVESEEQKEHTPPAEPVLNEKESVKGKKPALLLAEDNEDFRFYLMDNLKQFYHVIEAANGREAWQKIQQLSPDLVVSDIMMPEMNGLELSKKMKANVQTAHIPVILLTAMASEEQQLEGFATGINDYIVKPFNFQILVSRIRNLLAQKRQLRKSLQKQIDVNPSLIAVKSVDEKFINQAMEVVEKNIPNADFSVEELSRELFMSRVALYKKLLAITGKTPIEFIRTVRLKRAAHLLETSQLTVAEVAYEVGFNNPKYFSRYFKEAFGVLPSVYQQQKKKDSKA